MLELAILGLLRDHDLHGYEIRRRLRDELGVLTNVSFGSLYPALSRLEASGALAASVALPSGGPRRSAATPMTGSLGGERAMLRARMSGAAHVKRARKVYRITEAGRALFEQLLEADAGGADDARHFGLRLAFARYLPPQSRVRLLERRRAQLVGRLAQAREACRATKADLDPYARTLLEHAAEMIERDISWLDRLIVAERQGEPLGGLTPRGSPRAQAGQAGQAVTPAGNSAAVGSAAGEAGLGARAGTTRRNTTT